MKKGFFAYSNKHPSCGYTIEIAIEKVNQSNDYFIKSWTKLGNNGHLIIDSVIDEIKKADFFCADLTGMSDNVLFELGYAMAIKKPIFIITDPTLTESVRLFKSLGLLSTLALDKYTNATDIVNSFYKFASSTLTNKLRPLTSSVNKNIQKKALLYLKSPISTQYTTELYGLITKSKPQIPSYIDDASETPVQSLQWYIEKLWNVDYLLAEFINNQRSGHEIQNLKSALISGMAYGLELKVLIICEEPFETPIDYRDLLKKYNPKKFINIVTPFVEEIQENLLTILTAAKKVEYRQKEQTKLSNISFGSFIAEEEKEQLGDYFIETPTSKEIYNKPLSIVIGRKGSGKSAALYDLNDSLVSDKRNIIGSIKPVNFEIDGLERLIRDYFNDFESNFIIEAFWKFLLITEVAIILYEKVQSKVHSALTENDRKFIEYYESNVNIFSDEVSIRLEKYFDDLSSQTNNSQRSQSDFKAKVTEALHNNIIYDLKRHILNIVGQEKKIYILIDNLDKSWTPQDTNAIKSKIILGLIANADRIIGEMSVIKGSSKNLQLKVQLTIFLRSDIFKNIIKFAQEPDKINPSWLKWDDYEVFFRIIEARFTILNSKEESELWNNIMPKNIKGVPVQDFLKQIILPKPRDIIFFFKKAHEFAIQRGHTAILEEDVLSAYEDYSKWVFTTLGVESNKQIETFLYSLLDENAIICEETICQKMQESEIDVSSTSLIESFIDELISLSILAREVRENSFIFEYESIIEEKNKRLSKRLGSRRYKIHNALYPYLGIENIE